MRLCFPCCSFLFLCSIIIYIYFLLMVGGQVSYPKSHYVYIFCSFTLFMPPTVALKPGAMRCEVPSLHHHCLLSRSVSGKSATVHRLSWLKEGCVYDPVASIVKDRSQKAKRQQRHHRYHHHNAPPTTCIQALPLTFATSTGSRWELVCSLNCCYCASGL